ncbi:alcohol/choline dehydrogenase-like protein [Pseudomassariella vexata]|uniref:Alcohol/choline dehydrogenase-like protein n=1 Tax=Pseudomassariella vexata TaxID=1141098 RepID=A0A1Y2EKK1_9PEZI|nr:alcohol/choline dehydrogenase-like protein [Pseudomassariella vexata]ORY71375.1 alcohol/choline dehydrogenase-like protein [Pseudomassariella vexata]
MSPEYANDTTKLFSSSSDGYFFTLLGALEHPFPRGSVHIPSNNASVHPVIDPQYISHPLDRKLLGIIALHLQKIAQTTPLSELVEQPGYHKLVEVNVEEWIKKSIQSEYHPAGACAMLPKEKGGVIDAKLKVNGTRNLRVVDPSIFPLLPRANIQTLVYAVAERAANWIKSECGDD